MRWPLMWRATHDTYVAHCDAQHESLIGLCRDVEAQLAYWQGKAEKLLDHALFRAQAVTAPVFQPAPEKRADPMLSVLNALGRTEIETKPTAGAVTPMT